MKRRSTFIGLTILLGCYSMNGQLEHIKTIYTNQKTIHHITIDADNDGDEDLMYFVRPMGTDEHKLYTLLNDGEGNYEPLYIRSIYSDQDNLKLVPARINKDELIDLTFFYIGKSEEEHELFKIINTGKNFITPKQKD